MDCYVGSTTGAVKSIFLKDNTFTNVIPIKSLDPKRDEITAMAWGSDEQTELLTVQLDRTLKLLDCNNATQATVFVVDGGEGAVKGLHLTSDGEKIVTCVESGEAKIWSKNGKEQLSWNVGEGITVMQGSNNKNQLATGGTKNLVKTWDMETGKQLWSAKNVPLDMLQLEVPIMVTDLRFVEDENQILEATKLHEMRLYDPRAQRRPVKKISFMESPITSVSHCYRSNHVIAANSIGEMGLFDLRSKVHPVCKYKGQAGSIRSIDGHPTAPYIASCGIDRFVRVHDLETRKLIHKIYCKTRLNKILLRKDLSILKKIKKEEEDWEELEGTDESDEDSVSDDDENSDTVDSDDGDVWDEIDTQKKSRKRKEEDDEEENNTAPEPAKKPKTVPPRKRKDSDDIDEVIEEPRKKSKKENGKFTPKKLKKEVEIKEEVVSDDEEPVPAKKRRVSAPNKKKK